MALDPEEYFSKQLGLRLRAHPRLTSELAGLEAIADIELIEAPEAIAHWQVIFFRGTVEVVRGRSETPSFGVFLHLEDWRDLVEGAAKLQACLIDGRVEIEGDLGQAMQLLPLLLGSSGSE